ncbi:MAG TPA: Gfo/Idh/MocA family oxidoreductase [Planctomycetaceae bacterium]|nr:Gfo/Idh/MocA family oxidoreductase [Planctomycetaceae bacterium]
MSVQPIRIGIVGAGANTRERHIPGLRAIDGVEIIGVVNSTPESTARVAREYGIPRTYGDWRELIDDDEIDAVVIGTWPNLHCDVTCAALDAGKHVLTEARMARNAAEARRMLAASRAHPELVAQIVPSPFGLAQQPFVRGLLDDGFLGELRELVVIGAGDMFGDATKPLHWRQDREKSGLNILAMGILHETALRWAPPPVRVLAQTATFEPTRPLPGGGTAEVTVPDSVQVVTQLSGGGRGLYHISGIALFGPGMQIHLYGSRGTIRFEITPRERLLIGQAGENALRDVDIPPEERGGWRVEAEFIGAIRGQERVRFTDFATGVQSMQFTEAVHVSAASGRPVDLPMMGMGAPGD